MIKLLKFTCNDQRLFINPEHVCSVQQGDFTIIRMIDSVEYHVSEPIFEVVEALKRNPVGKSIIKSCKGSQ